MEKNKNMWIGIGVVVIIIVIYLAMSSSSVAPAVTDNQIIPTEDTSAGSVNVGAPVASISYAQALVKYKDARIQLDENCQASPNSVTYKNGTNIMIDNRSSVIRTIKVGSDFNVKAWGFKIVKLSSKTLPITWLVDCGASQNVATILIQK